MNSDNVFTEVVRENGKEVEYLLEPCPTCGTTRRTKQVIRLAEHEHHWLRELEKQESRLTGKLLIRGMIALMLSVCMLVLGLLLIFIFFGTPYYLALTFIIPGVTLLALSVFAIVTWATLFPIPSSIEEKTKKIIQWLMFGSCNLSCFESIHKEKAKITGVENENNYIILPQK